MSRLLSSFWFTRLTASVIAANYLTLVVLNAAKAPVGLTPVLYLLLLCGMVYVSGWFTPRRHSAAGNRPALALVGIALVLLTIPRLTYLLDWLPQNTTLTHSDDYARMLEVLAMTANKSYPLLSPSNSMYLFSFYYTALYPFAVLKLALPVLTIKECIAAGNLFYHLVMLLSIYEVSQVLLRQRRRATALVFFCSVFGGAEWMTFRPFAPLGHFEWWQLQFFSGNTQVSSFYTAQFWVVHHFVAAYAAVLAYVFLFCTRCAKGHTAKTAFVSTLLLSSFYSSPFSFLPLPLFLIVHRRVVLGKFMRIWPNYALALSALIPLYLFLGKLPGQTFTWSTFRLQATGVFWVDKVISLPLYLALVPLVEFLAIPMLLLGMWRRLTSRQRQYVILCWVFFASTYVVAFSGVNNYCMRGMLLPSFIFLVVFAYHWPDLLKRWQLRTGRPGAALVYAVVLLSSIGTLKESAARGMEAAGKMALSYRMLGGKPPAVLTLPVYEVAVSSDIEKFDANRFPPQFRFHFYEFEKFVEGLELEDMLVWEKELLRSSGK